VYIPDISSIQNNKNNKGDTLWKKKKQKDLMNFTKTTLDYSNFRVKVKAQLIHIQGQYAG